MRNTDLAARKDAAVARGISTATGIFADRAENAELWDIEGKRYIDFAAGIAVLNVGHRHPRVMAAVAAQLGSFSHTAWQVMPYAPYVELAERLNAIAPIEGPAKSLFFTTGAEATENAIKVARGATGRPGVIAFAGAFHGRTHLACSMTGKVVPYKKDLGPFASEVYHLPYPSVSTGVTLADTARALDLLFSASIDPARVAAIIFEPVQGEGGFHVPDPGLFSLLEETRRRHGILLIADEVQTGFGRTGRMFGVEHGSLRPDLICVAKALGGGFPLAGLVGRAEIMDALPPGGMGTTYGGSPLACAAALAVLDIIEEDRLVERANMLGGILRDRIGVIAHRRPDIISPPRGLGAMIAFDVLGMDGQADGIAARAVCVRALEKGLLLLTCGPGGQSVRILVPLTISEAQLGEGLAILEQALTCAEQPTAT
ncbi:MAG: 4-aminobutyrate--2-oxoglutarate transaminase [Sphingobium sp.]